MNADGTIRFTDRSEILKRWAEHFNNVLSQPSIISLAALDETTQHPIIHQLEARPNIAETTQAIKKLTSGKAAGSDAITPEIYKHGGINLIKRLVKLFTIIWDSRSIPPDFKDASLVHIYKRKGDITICYNHRGVPLLYIAGEILARIMLNRLAHHTADNGLPESQCGFQTGRRTTLAKAARRFGLTISLKKTEVMFQSKPDTNHVPPNITIDNVTLNVVDKFTCLGSTLSENAMIDDDISARLGKASASFCRLSKRLWHERGDVLTTLLYGCEAWTWRRTYNLALRV